MIHRKSKIKARITAALLVFLMVASTVLTALPISAKIQDGLTFGHNLLYAADKKLHAVPKTFEARLTIDESWLTKDSYPGTVIGCYSGALEEYGIIMDIVRGGPRIYMYFPALNGNTSYDVQADFDGALTGLGGKEVHILITLNPQLESVTLYINGAKSSLSPDYNGTGKQAAFWEAYKQILPSRLPTLTIGGDHRLGNGTASGDGVTNYANWRYLRNCTLYYAAVYSDTFMPEEAKYHYLGQSQKSTAIAQYDLRNLTNVDRIFDESGNGYDLTPSRTMQKVGMSFSQTELYKQNLKTALVPKSYEAWVQITSGYTDRAGVIISGYDAKNTSVAFEIYQNGAPRIYIDDRTSGSTVPYDYTFSNINVANGFMNHVAIVQNADKSFTCYVNGYALQTLTTSSEGRTFSGTLTMNKSLCIGGDERSNNAQYFKGKIYSAAIFEESRHGHVINDMYGVPTNCTAPFSWYEVSEMSDNNFMPDLGSAGNTAIRSAGLLDGSGLIMEAGTLYSASKQLTAVPKTLEATFTVATQMANSSTTYAGTLIGCNDDAYQYDDSDFIMDVMKCGIRILIIQNGNIAGMYFPNVLTNYKGQTIHVAVTVDTANKTAKCYINGQDTGVSPTFEHQATSNSALFYATYSMLDPAMFRNLTYGGDVRSGNARYLGSNCTAGEAKILGAALFSDIRSAAEILADTRSMPFDSNLLCWFESSELSNSGIIPDLSGNGYDLTSSRRWFTDRPEVEDYAYSFVIIGDTQMVARNEVCTDRAEYSPNYKGNADKIFDYIVDNVEEKNTQFVFHMGDMTDLNTDPEWSLIMNNFAKLDGVVPYNMVRGNHDSANELIKYFRRDNFVGNVPAGEEYGSFDNTTLNTWQTITIGKVKYLMLALDFGPSKAVIEWANEVISSHPNHNVIISTHSYLYEDSSTKTLKYVDDPKDCAATQYNPGGVYGKWDFRLDYYKSKGDDFLYQDATYMLNNLVKKHENIVMVLCGHELCDKIGKLDVVGEKGNTVSQFLIDAQGIDSTLQAAGLNHAGIIATFYFSEDGKKVTTEYYSTILEKYFVSENIYSFEIDMIEASPEAEEDREDYAESETGEIPDISFPENSDTIVDSNGGTGLESIEGATNSNGSTKITYGVTKSFLVTIPPYVDFGINGKEQNITITAEGVLVDYQDELHVSISSQFDWNLKDKSNASTLLVPYSCNTEYVKPTAETQIKNGDIVLNVPCNSENLQGSQTLYFFTDGTSQAGTFVDTLTFTISLYDPYVPGDETEEPDDDETIESSTQDPEATEPEDPNDDGVLKILAVGNSFSVDAMEYVYKIAKSAGVENIKLGNLYIGGCTLNTHANNARNDSASYTYYVNDADTWTSTASYKMSDAIKSENWDYITLQQASGSSGFVDTYSEVEYMISYVKGLCPNATIAWHMVWAYQQDATHSEFPKYNNDQMTMYESIVSAVNAKIVPNNDIAMIIPNGTAIQNARTSYLGDTLTRDGYHLSYDIGRYIAGLTYFSKLTGIAIDDITYRPSGVSEDVQKIAIEAATAAIATPFEISESVYPLPDLTGTLYYKLDLGWTPLGYWNSDTTAGIDTSASNSSNFYATKKFTREELPVGSVIVVASGWKYRPEGWPHNGIAKPDMTTSGVVMVTESWWADYETRAFNLTKTDGSSLAGLTQSDIDAAFTVYVPYSANYIKLEIDWTALAYWESSLATSMFTASSNSYQYYATEKFTRAEIPVGSIIAIAEGWAYRPDAWAYRGSRPATVTDGKPVVVTEAWWDAYTHRAFNLWKSGAPSLVDVPESEVDAAFAIYIPKN